MLHLPLTPFVELQIRPQKLKRGSWRWAIEKRQKGYVIDKISPMVIIHTNSQCTYSDLTTNTGAMEQTEYIKISSFQLRFSIDCNKINGQ